jgi:type IV pilus biogenesis protein CpaD/CtpE
MSNPDDLLSEQEVRTHLAEERAKVIAASQAGFQLIAKVQELEKELAEKRELYDGTAQNRAESVLLKCEKMEVPRSTTHPLY